MYTRRRQIEDKFTGHVITVYLKQLFWILLTLKQRQL